jgi:prepilin-type N-terminal cleavage/methylation domain-containing protein/prepilin-type processing-associated H-X9-DG protein
MKPHDNRRRALRRRRDNRARPAFTLLELLVVIVLIAVVTAILLPTVNRTRCGGSTRVKCGSNLRQIGQAMLMYANENTGAYPRTIYLPGAHPTFSEDATDGATGRDPFGLNGQPGLVAPNDVAAAIWLILRTQDITTEIFTCPSSNTDKDLLGNPPAAGATAQNKTSFTNLSKHLAYGFANPYPSPAAANDGYKWNNKLGAELAVAADRGPTTTGTYDVTAPADYNASAAVMKKANSPNHLGEGQNVLFGDGHVEFVQNPFCGTQRDHIYTNAPAAGVTTSRKLPVGPDAIPGWYGDSVLLPLGN